jgi:hypothetical protein
MADNKPAKTVDFDEPIQQQVQFDEEAPAEKQPEEKPEDTRLPWERTGKENLWSAIKPWGFVEDTSNALKRAGQWIGQQGEAAHEENLRRIARGEQPGLIRRMIPTVLGTGASTAKMAGGLVEPQNIAIGAATAVAPEVMGPALAAHGLYGAEQAREQAQKEGGWSPETAEAGLSSLAEAAGGGAATGEAVHGGLRNTMTARAVDKAVRGTPMTEAGRIQAAVEQARAVKEPSLKETDYVDRVKRAVPDLQKIAQDNGGKITTPRLAVDAINQRITQIENPIGEHIAQLPNTPENMVEEGAWRQGMDQAMSDHLQHPASDHYGPKEIEKARKAVHELAGEGNKSLADIERLRRRLNDDAADYYKAKKAGGGFSPDADAVAAFKAASADGLRDMLYGKEGSPEPGLLEKAGVRVSDANGNPMGMRQVRQQVGDLINIRNNFQKAITRAEAAGDWSAFDVARKGPSLAAGGVGSILGIMSGGPVGAVLGTGLGEGAKIWADYRTSKNPNLNVRKMFRNLEQTAPARVPQITTTGPTQPITPQPQFAQAQGPLEASTEPVQGAAPAPQPFQVESPASRSAMWEPQVGAPPRLGWEPIQPKVEPITPNAEWKLGAAGATELPPAERTLPAPKPQLEMPGAAELAHPEMFPARPGTAEPERFVYREPKSGKMRRGYKEEGIPQMVGQTAEGGPIREGQMAQIPRTETPAETLRRAGGEEPRTREIPVIQDGKRGTIRQLEGTGPAGNLTWATVPGSFKEIGAAEWRELSGGLEPKAAPGFGGEGREAVIGRMNAPGRPEIQMSEGEDLGGGLGKEHILTRNGERIGSITIEDKGNGTLHVHWLGGEFDPKEIRGPLVDALREQYPDAKEITYDRRRVTKASEPKTEARSLKLPEKKTLK